MSAWRAPAVRMRLGAARLVVPFFFLSALAALRCAHAQDAQADGEASVTPYRPTVSNPADLPAPGWLEGEFGLLRTRGEDRSRDDSAPWLLKYAFDENHGLLLGGDAFVRAAVPGEATRSGGGDTFVEWKQRFPVSEHAAFGFEAGVVAPTAPHGLGVGKPAWIVNGILSTDVGAAHLDVNLGAERFTAPPAGASSWQSTWAAAASTSIDDQWGAAFELSGSHERGTPTQSQALVAFTYNVSKRLVLDAGGAYGLARAAHDRSIFAGATVLLGRFR